jgi:hypothetical protein
MTIGFEEISGLVIKIGCLLTLRKQALDVANEVRVLLIHVLRPMQQVFVEISRDFWL